MRKIISENGFKIRKIIKNFTGNYNEDLEQEVYIKTYKNLGKYIEQNKFSNWICTITANLCRDYLKSSKFKQDSSNSLDDETLNSISCNKTPEKEYSSNERQKIILKEINALPKKMKEVIILLEFRDFSYEQISKKLNIPIGTVKSRVNSARKILQEKLAFLMKEDNE